jgi:branched-chain amino acid aminotransferase
VTIAASLGYQVIERDFTRSDLVIADEAFFTGTAAEVVPIREVDDHLIGEPGPITKAIQAVFHEIIGGESKEYDRYLEYVND